MAGCQLADAVSQTDGQFFMKESSAAQEILDGGIQPEVKQLLQSHGPLTKLGKVGDLVREVLCRSCDHR